MCPKQSGERIALETIEIYAAIAHRLGMGLVRRELEDLAFQYAYPEEYAKTKKLLTERVKANHRSVWKKCKKLCAKSSPRTA